MAAEPAAVVNFSAPVTSRRVQICFGSPTDDDIEHGDHVPNSVIENKARREYTNVIAADIAALSAALTSSQGCSIADVSSVMDELAREAKIKESSMVVRAIHHYNCVGKNETSGNMERHE